MWKKFLKLWYKKKKISLQISLSKSTEPQGVHDVVSIGTLEVIPIDTLGYESMFLDTTNDAIAQEDMI